MAKKKTPEEEMEELVRSIRREFEDWKKVKKRGTTDPSYPDGVNLNLIRNHIFYDQARLKELCKKKCPPEARMKPPRKVSETYMAPGSKAMRFHRKTKK